MNSKDLSQIYLKLNFLFKMKPCKIQVLVRVQEFTAATEEVEDKKKIMQNFNL